jgi:hypothetical protein
VCICVCVRASHASVRVYVFFGPRTKFEAKLQTLRTKPRKFSLLSSDGWWVKAKCTGLKEETYVLCTQSFSNEEKTYVQKVVYISKRDFLVRVRQIFECNDPDGLMENATKKREGLQKMFCSVLEGLNVSGDAHVDKTNTAKLSEAWHGDGFLSRVMFAEAVGAEKFAKAVGDADDVEEMLKLFNSAIGRR